MNIARIATALCMTLFLALAGCPKDGEDTVVPYEQPVMIAGIALDNGTTAGGDSVTVFGFKFQTGATVDIGGNPATNVTVVSDTVITCDTPAGSAGAADVVVTNAGGDFATLTGGYTYIAPPTITTISPNTGATAGSTTITITGTGFQNGATVTVGGTAATNMTVVSDTSITCDTPAGSAGAADVVVLNPTPATNRSVTETGGFTYVAPPTISTVSPNSGPTAGGTSITITGADFQSGATVTVGGTAATNVVFVNSTSITCDTPSGSAGAADVVVTNPTPATGNSDTETGGFTYIAPPTITNINPNFGDPAGGTSITITGTDFQSGATVTVGGTAATSVTFVSSTSITCDTPAGSAGAADVVVTNPAPTTGNSATSTGGFTFDGSAPTFSGIQSALVISSSAVELRWNAASDDNSPASGISYNIYIATSSGGHNFSSPNFTTDKGATSFTTGGLSGSVTYYFIVRAVDDSTNEDVNSVEISATTPVTPAVSWNSTSSMTNQRSSFEMTLLNTGKAMVTAGYNAVNTDENSAEIYDPTTGTWSTGGTLTNGGCRHTATVLPSGKVLVAGGESGGATSLSRCELYDPSNGTWSSTGSLSSGRYSHAAILLLSGKVLVAGGYLHGTGFLSSCEVYDPASGTWSPTGSMINPRTSATITLLPSGLVLVAGGYNGTTIQSSAELYDPSSGTWTATGSMTGARQSHTATLIPSGEVLVAGGNASNTCLDTVELYDPSSGTWSSLNSMGTPRYGHTADLLPNGMVLVVGGQDDYFGNTHTNTVEIFNPLTGNWNYTGSISITRAQHASVILPSGKILVAGGRDSNNGNYLASAELYDPSAGYWCFAGNLGSGHALYQASILPSGKVHIAGGQDSTGVIATTETFDPNTGTWSSSSNLQSVETSEPAILLPNGNVLISGGTSGPSAKTSCQEFDSSQSQWSSINPLNNARCNHSAILLVSGDTMVFSGGSAGGPGNELAITEKYNATSGNWTNSGSLNTARYMAMGALLPDGKVLITGGSANSSHLSSSEIYNPGTDSWSFTTGSMSTVRYLGATCLLDSGKVLVTGGETNWIPGTATASAEIYDPSAGTWSATNSMATARSQFTSTLLFSGKYIVVGGRPDNNGSPFANCETYDPETGQWSVTSALNTARFHARGILLCNGRLMVAGGTGNPYPTYLTTTEVFDEGRGFASCWQPKITEVDGSNLFPVAVSFGSTVEISGEKFTGLLPGIGGASNGVPIVKLLGPLNGYSTNHGNIGNGRNVVLPATNFGTSSLDINVPSSGSLPPGYYMLRVIVNGIHSKAVIIKLQ